MAKIAVLVISVLSLGILAAGCGGGSGSESSTSSSSAGASAESTEGSTGEAEKGGTYTAQVPDFSSLTGTLDPVTYEGWSIYPNVVRTLVQAKPNSDGTFTPVADLAELPEVSANETEYTFHLKKGIAFGPPVSRPITSKDVKYAFERMVDPDLAAQYPFYYEGVIQGFKVGQKQISGITTPNATTIVFKLTKPVGDFLYRLMLPAAAPVPKEVAECFKTEPGAYGRYIVSSGPYMIEGAEKDEPWTGCGAAAYSGFNPNTGKLNLVRNPAYNPASDEPGLRPAYLDRLEFTANSNESDIVNKILAGELDGEQEVSSFELIKAAATNNVGEQLKVGPSDLVQYLGMNLTQPPFDDVHVRRAVNYVIDKEAVLRTLGGKQAGTIATHIVPDSMLEDQLEGYEPYGSPEGDLAAAKREMKKSKYGNAEGMCDAPECKGIYAVNEPGEEAKTQVIVSELKEIGLELQVKTVQNYDTEVRKPSLNIAMWLLAGWGKDYKDASTFIEPLFDSKAINGEATYNYGLVGLTPKVASEIGVEGDINNIPNVDGEIEKCQPLSGKARSTCWAKLDEKLTTEVVSLVPLYVQNLVRLVGPEVTSWASAWEKVPFGNGSRPAYNWIAVEGE